MPSLTTLTARQHDLMGSWQQKSVCWGCWRRSSERLSPALSLAASTHAPPSVTPASPGLARFRRIGTRGELRGSSENAMSVASLACRSWRYQSTKDSATSKSLCRHCMISARF